MNEYYTINTAYEYIKQCQKSLHNIMMISPDIKDELDKYDAQEIKAMMYDIYSLTVIAIADMGDQLMQYQKPSIPQCINYSMELYIDYVLDELSGLDEMYQDCDGLANNRHITRLVSTMRIYLNDIKDIEDITKGA